MNEAVANIAGGLGLFVAGMWLLTRNLKSWASRRLRRQAAKWKEATLPGTGSVLETLERKESLQGRLTELNAFFEGRKGALNTRRSLRERSRGLAR